MADNKKTIFISYGRDQENPEDVELVRRVKCDLEEEGFVVLMDEEQLRSADVWDEKLENMILNSDWILYFITPYSARRPEGYCLNELAMSLAYKKPVAPVMVRYEVPPLSICRIQYLDLESIDINDEQQYQKKIDEIISVIREDNRLGFEGDHLRVLSEIEPIKFETMISKHSKRFVGREWLYKQVNEWLDDGTSRVLWLQAKAGFGKSAIATYLASKHPSALSVYFCQYDYAESKDPREMLKVLIYELSTQLPEYHKILQTLHLKDALSKSAEHIFTQLLLEPLQRISKPDTKFFFVIDALDEANKENKNEIVELIANRFLDLPEWLGIVMTSRPEPELERKLKKFNPLALDTEEDENLKDMEMLLGENYGIDDPHIIEVLIRKSEGNVLYLKSLFDLDIIKKNELDTGSIDKLPPTMEGFFLTYFERKFPNIEEYEEKYLDFVSLLVSQKGLEEILVQDILQLSEREYKRLKSAFGSLLEIDNGKLTFYHKSLFEWLGDYDKSGEYSANETIGKELFENFINELNVKSYKGEYITLENFNKILIDRIFKKNRNLKAYFELLYNIEDEAKVKTYISLGIYYDQHNKMYQAIVLHEESLEIAKRLYRYNPDKWVEYYTAVLNNLALSYQKFNRFSEAIALNEENFKIIKILYDNDSNRWVEEYTAALINLSSSYYESNQILKVIHLLEESLNITRTLYHHNPDRWVKYYTLTLTNLAMSYQKCNRLSEAILLEEENFGIIKMLYSKDSDRWAEDYVRTLNNLALLYKDGNRLFDAIALEEESLKITNILYQDNLDRWVEYYTFALTNLAMSYQKCNRLSEAILLEEENFGIIKMLYSNDSDRWAEDYVRTLNNLALLYKDSNRLSDAILLEEENLKITKVLYHNDPDKWVKDYTSALNNLALSYKYSSKTSESIILQKETLKIRKVLYSAHPDQWAEAYTRALNNLATSYYNSNQISKAIPLQEESLELRKMFYQNNPDQWAEAYITALNNLALSYQYSSRLPESILLQEESLEIIKVLYQNNLEEWAELYATALNNLGTLYYQEGQYQNALDLITKQYEVVLKQYDKEHTEIKQILKNIEIIKKALD